MSLFTSENLIITGDTGSFRNAVLNRFLNTDIGEIRISEEKLQSILEELDKAIQK